MNQKKNTKKKKMMKKNMVKKKKKKKKKMKKKKKQKKNKKKKKTKKKKKKKKKKKNEKNNKNLNDNDGCIGSKKIITPWWRGTLNNGNESDVFLGCGENLLGTQGASLKIPPFLPHLFVMCTVHVSNSLSHHRTSSS